MVYANWAKIDKQGNMGFAPYGPGSGSLNSLSTYYPQATVKIPGQDITATMVGFSIEF